MVSASAGQSRSPGSWPVEYVSSGSGLSWGLTGGYRINQYIGVEGGYRDLGQRTVRGPQTIDTKTMAWMVGESLTYPLTEKLEIAARLGYFVAITGAAFSETGFIISSRQSDAYYGIGVAWVLEKRISASLNWTRFDSASNNASNIDDIEFDVTYRF